MSSGLRQAMKVASNGSLEVNGISLDKGFVRSVLSSHFQEPELKARGGFYGNKLRILESARIKKNADIDLARASIAVTSSSTTFRTLK